MIFCTKQLFKSCFAVVFSVQHTVFQGYNVAETVLWRVFLAMRFFGKKGDCNEGFTQIRCKTGLRIGVLGEKQGATTCPLRGFHLWDRSLEPPSGKSY